MRLPLKGNLTAVFDLLTRTLQYSTLHWFRLDQHNITSERKTVNIDPIKIVICRFGELDWHLSTGNGAFLLVSLAKRRLDAIVKSLLQIENDGSNEWSVELVNSSINRVYPDLVKSEARISWIYGYQVFLNKKVYLWY